MSEMRFSYLLALGIIAVRWDFSLTSILSRWERGGLRHAPFTRPQTLTLHRAGPSRASGHGSRTSGRGFAASAGYG